MREEPEADAKSVNKGINDNVNPGLSRVIEIVRTELRRLESQGAGDAELKAMRLMLGFQVGAQAQRARASETREQRRTLSSAS